MATIFLLYCGCFDNHLSLLIFACLFICSFLQGLICLVRSWVFHKL